MAFCTKCGAVLVAGSSSCAACGASFGAAPNDKPVAVVHPQGSPQIARSRESDPEPANLCAGPYDDPDRYQLLQLRSRGGEGEVWRSALPIDGVPLPVAVKVINQTNNDRLDDWSRRWKQQAEILKTLDHPSLVKVRDTFEGPLPHAPGTADLNSRSLFLVMNWVNGESLVEWVARNPDRDLLDSTRIIARIAGAVDYLHSGASTGKPVLHRDIKPANVLIDGTNVCLVDFGFARLMSGELMTLAGTPHYMAPEVVGGGVFGESSDRFALGATAYYTIVGEPPTPGDRDAMKAKLARARGVDGRADLAEHILAMMDPDPAKRPTNTVEWAQALAAGAVSTSLPAHVPAATAAAERPHGGRKGRRIVIAAVVLFIVAAVVAAGVTYALAERHSNAPAAGPSAASAPIADTSPSVAASASDSAVPSAEPSTSGAPTSAEGVTIMNLAQYAQPVDGSVDTNEATMKTKPYLFSLWMDPNEDYPSQYVEYNVPSGFTHFQATIGLDDTSGSSGKTTFQVTDAITGDYLYGGPDHLVTLGVNQVRNVDITLPANILRIKLTTVSHADDDGWSVGVHPIWGDAQLTGPQGQATLPQASSSPGY